MGWWLRKDEDDGGDGKLSAALTDLFDQSRSTCERCRGRTQRRSASFSVVQRCSAKISQILGRGRGQEERLEQGHLLLLFALVRACSVFGRRTLCHPSGFLNMKFVRLSIKTLTCLKRPSPQPSPQPPQPGKPPETNNLFNSREIDISPASWRTACSRILPSLAISIFSGPFFAT